MIPVYGEFNKAKTKKLGIANGKLVLYDLKKEDEEELLEMGGRISEASFLSDENLVSFNYEDNIYLYDLKNGSLKKLTNIHSGEKKDRKGSGSGSEKAKWLEKENLDLLQVVRERKENAEASKRYREMTQDQLAKQAGVTRHTIMALEAGKYFPSLLPAFRIARAFGAHVEQVFEYQATEFNV